MDYSQIITIDPSRRSGKACIRGLRITVYDVLGYMAAGMSQEEILADFPEMGQADDPHLRDWLDSEGNMLVLCSDHHRHGLVGIHMVTYPAWVAQRWLKVGHDISQH